MEDNYRNCYLHNWYSEFENLTIKSRFFELPSGVRNFILNTPFIIPKNLLEIADENYDLRHLDSLVNDTLAQFKPSRSVIVKLNSSTLDDVSYMVMNSEVTDTMSLIKLLKASNKASYEFVSPFSIIDSKETNDTFVIGFREIIDIKPKGEFRLFFKSSKLYAISQRYLDFKLVNDSETKNGIISWVNRWLKLHTLPCSDIVIDVYVRGTKGEQRDILILDMEPLNEFTNMLLVDQKNPSDEVTLYTLERDNVPIQSRADVESRYPLELTAALAGDKNAIELLKEIGLKI